MDTCIVYLNKFFNFWDFCKNVAVGRNGRNFVKTEIMFLIHKSFICNLICMKNRKYGLAFFAAISVFYLFLCEIECKIARKKRCCCYIASCNCTHNTANLEKYLRNNLLPSQLHFYICENTYFFGMMLIWRLKIFTLSLLKTIFPY